MTADLFDVLGRRVRRVYDADVPEGGQIAVSIPRGTMTAGQYFLRISGKSFVATRRVVVAK